MKRIKSALVASTLLVCAPFGSVQAGTTSKADMANMARLVGNWRGEPTQQYQYGHLELSLQGSGIVVTAVQDRDDLLAKRLKGEKSSYASFRLNGRRLNGFIKSGSHQDVPRTPVTGIVSENFRQIHWRFSLGAQTYMDETLLRE